MRTALLPIALIWANHIGVDRLLGYGLKYADGFGWTHLGRVGRKAGVMVAGLRFGSASRGINAPTTSDTPKPISADLIRRQ